MGGQRGFSKPQCLALAASLALAYPWVRTAGFCSSHADSVPKSCAKTTLASATCPAGGTSHSLVQVQSAGGTLEAGSALQGEGRHAALSSAFSSSSGTPGLGWAWAEGLSATGQHLLGYMRPARRGLAAATAPAAPPAASPAAAPAASTGNQTCQAIQAAAAAGAALNFTSVETFCLNQACRGPTASCASKQAAASVQEQKPS